MAATQAGGPEDLSEATPMEVLGGFMAVLPTP